MNLPPSIRLTETSPNYPVLEIEHESVKAKVTLLGAHITEWTPAGSAPVLYISPQAVFQEGKAIRGGVPICWPWFGPNESAPGLPSHGFVRTRFWSLAEASEDAAGVRLVLKTQSDEDTLKLWPHAFELSMTMHIGAELSLALEMVNIGDTSFEVTGALHSYLSVQDITQVLVTGLDGKEYVDRLTCNEIHQAGDIVIDREVDREYLSTGTVVVKDASSSRELSVTPSGSGCTVVWNPWIDKAIRLADVPDEDYKVFVCVETANAWKDVVTVAPAEYTPWGQGSGLGRWHKTRSNHALSASRVLHPKERLRPAAVETLARSALPWRCAHSGCPVRLEHFKIIA